MPTTEKQDIATIVAFCKRTDKQTLTFADAVVRQYVRVKSYRKVADLTTGLPITMSYGQIRKYVMTRQANPDATAAEFADLMTAVNKTAREATGAVTTGDDSDKSTAVTPGNARAPRKATVTDAATAIAAFTALLTTVDALPAKERTRALDGFRRAIARRYGKAA